MSFWGKKPVSQTGYSVESTPVNPTAESSPKDISLIKSKQATSDEERYGKVRSALGSGTIIQGKLSFDTVVSIDGRLKGEVFSSKALIVGASGIVDADIDVTSLVIFGTVKGSIKVSDRLEIRAGGQLIGDAHAPSFIVEEGGVFSGNCVMGVGRRSDGVLS